MYLNEDDIFVMNRMMRLLKLTLRKESKKLSLAKTERLSLTKQLNAKLNEFNTIYSLKKEVKERKFIIYVSSQEYEKVVNFVRSHTLLHPDESMFATAGGAFGMGNHELAEVDIAVKQEEFLSPFRVTTNQNLISKSKTDYANRRDYIQKDFTEIRNLGY